MPNVWFCLTEIAMGLGFLPPILQPRVGASQKFLKIDGAVTAPNTAGRTEIGNAAFGTDACPGEGDGAARFGEPASRFNEVGHSYSSRF